jgi:hypothetical protein
MDKDKIVQKVFYSNFHSLASYLALSQKHRSSFLERVS